MRARKTPWIRLWSATLAATLGACSGPTTTSDRRKDDAQFDAKLALKDGLDSFTDEAPWDGSQPLKAGDGFDSLRRRDTGDCVKGVEHALPAATETTFTLKRIATPTDLRQALAIAPAAALAYEAGSGDGRVAFGSDASPGRYGVFAVVRVEVQTASTDLAGAVLDPAKAAQLASDKAAFQRACGDRWVKGARRGGELIAVLQVVAHNETEETALRGVADRLPAATFGSFAKADDLAAAIRAFTGMGQASAFGFVRGGPAPGATPAYALNMLTARVSTFASEIPGQETNLDAVLEDYGTLLNTPDPIDVSSLTAPLQALAQASDHEWATAASLRYARGAPTEFGASSTVASKALPGVISNLTKISDAYTACIDHGTCAAPATLGLTAIDPPVHEVHNFAPAAVCGVARAGSGTDGNICGWTYKTIADSWCAETGVKYGTSYGICGEVPNSRRYTRGPNRCIMPDDDVEVTSAPSCAGSEVDLGTRIDFAGPCGPHIPPRIGREPPDPVGQKRFELRTCATPAGCYNRAFGVTYAACADPHHGVDHANSCTSTSFPNTVFNTCWTDAQNNVLVPQPPAP